MIVGTAGHVDHGKTTLVRALTGIDTDRLKEEKARGITIDLGFAYMPGPGPDPDDAPIGFVDVPGHERLVRTMVAGAAGIDFALLVVAADDGVMPQTREHLDILALLGLTRGAVAITKSDRVDAARRDAVSGDLAALLAGTPFADAERLFVSAVTGDGVDALRDHLRDAARAGAGHRRRGVFRLPVDRSFVLSGVGTVVTGTALAGSVAVGEEVTVLPGRHRARVRSLHAQSREAAAGQAGERCALALSGLAKEAVARGAWVCGGAAPADTQRVDADLRLLAGERRPLRDWTPVHLHCGASDVPARVVVLTGSGLSPGTTAPAQLVLERPLPLRHGDLFVVRDQSGQRTIGGGSVLDPQAPLRKRRSPERLARLDALRPNDPALALPRLLALDPGFEDHDAFAATRGLTAAEAETLRVALGLEALRAGATSYLHTAERWLRLRTAVVAHLSGFHAANPELPGLAGERLRVSLAPVLPKPLFAAVRDRLIAERRVALQGHWLRLPGHVAELAADDKRIAARVAPLVAGDRFRPPRVRDMARDLGLPEPGVRRTCKALVRTGEFAEIAPDHFFLRATVAEMAVIADTLTRTQPDGLFSAADFRDRLDNGRKVAIQILEYFDRQGLTFRKGDLRRVVKAPDLIFGARPEAA